MLRLRADRVFELPPDLVGPQAVAIILDEYGGIRTVCGEASAMPTHTHPNELCLIVPDWSVVDPVPWEAIPFVIAQSRNYLEHWIATSNDPEYGGFKQHVTLYGLRCLEHPASKRAHDVPSMALT